MKKNERPEIGDNEIRIIAGRPASGRPASGPTPDGTQRRGRMGLYALAFIALAIVGVVVYLLLSGGDADEQESLVVETETPAEPALTDASEDETPVVRYPHAVVSEQTVSGHRFVVLRPVDATPVLAVGADVLDDSTAILVTQAADIRRDNGLMVGAFVLGGELMSKGQSKSGYCAIIDGELSIGVATATPLLEKAIESDGYFFRQYPLVAGNQPVENLQKGKSLRKALATIGDETVVILSVDRMTMNEFARFLAEMGTEEAIYLVGSTAYGIAREESGRVFRFGERSPEPAEYVNYIVWR